MRKSVIALLLLAGVAACVATTAYASDEGATNDFGLKMNNAHIQQMLRSAAAKQGISGAQGPGDTTWVGYAPAQAYNPLDPAHTNYWSIGPGPNSPQAPSYLTTGVWNFENQVHGDSLCGWWPIRMAHTNNSVPMTDNLRPWWAIEMGNNANYVINQGDATDPAHLGTSYKRTFGVVGVWHSDPGNGVPGPTGSGGTGVNWAPLGGTHSAWMGLRQHADLTVADNITGQPFNVDALQYNGTGGGGTGTQKTFPGYGAQMDQMLYKDIDISAESGPVTVEFKFRTNMSTLHGTTTTRTGWFFGDPTSINTPTAGNFISAEAGAASFSDPNNYLCPVDSFEVYVGAPVEGTWISSKDNVARPIYDPLRRWFNEVVARDTRFWLFGAAGVHGATTQTVTVTADMITAIKATGATKARLVFRVHTNAGSSDESGPATFTSNGQGAAQVDDIKWGLTTIGDFETSGGVPGGNIDNTQSASNAWRSTGKPPAIYFHIHPLASLAWNDLCGDVNNPFRICDMRGVVISFGNHDAAEKAAGPLGTTEEEGNWGVISPSIGLKGQGGDGLNPFGLTLAQATPTQGFIEYYDLYAGIFDVFATGVAYQFYAQSYPSLQQASGSGGTSPAPGSPNWGEIRLPLFLYFNPLVQCYSSFEDLTAQGQILSANGSGLVPPDSVRIGIRQILQCYRFGVTSNCGPTGGAYVDNLALAILDGAPNAISVDIWNWFNDTFPANETDALAGTADFDTTSALIRTGFNAAQATGNLQRYDVPGDSVLISAPDVPSEHIRVDMIFRIKPGVGNYVTVGNPSSGLRDVPTSTTPATAGSFWHQFMGAPSDVSAPTAGAFATSNAVALDAAWLGAGLGEWNWNVWRSARCDTAETGLFPVEAKALGDVGVSGVLDANYWQSTYHESDPHYSTLGIVKNRCFVVNPALQNGTAANVTCSSVPAWLPAGAPGNGFDGSSTTLERTSIIPDGLLTPGAHVEYFFAKRKLSDLTTQDMCPDTNTVSPQNSEGPSFDGHRWQQFGVLPDRWKELSFGGQGMACMLYVDLNDRRGDERVWVSIADSIGATAAAKRGGHNGWSAPGGADINNPAYFVAAHYGQPGTTWDMYGVKASESLTTSSGALGGRYAYRANPVGNLVDGKYAKMAPTPAMLAAYYKMLMILTGDLNSGVFGPFADRSQNDLRIMQEYLSGATVSIPRGFMITGDGYAESLWNWDTGPNGEAFLNNWLGMDMFFFDYKSLSGRAEQVVDLQVSSDITPNGDIYGVRNACTYTNDVLMLNPSLTEAKVSAYYQNSSPPDPSGFIAGVYKPSFAPRYWTAISDAYDIFHLTGRYDIADQGRLAYFYNVMKNIFSSFCTVQGAPSTTLDTPNNTRYVNFVKIGNNASTTARATVLFSLAKTDRVQIKVYDVTGRLVRTLADRVFQAGPNSLTWDGVDDHGSTVARGVYFAKTTFAGQNFQSANKMIVLN